MANALDYILWRGDLTVDRDPVNELDLFLFSQLSTPDYEEVLSEDGERSLEEVLKEYLERNKDTKKLGVLQSRYILPMCSALKNAPRYKNLSFFMPRKLVKDAETEQFQAVSIHSPSGFTVVSFRGTDDTLTGWKENICMAIKEEIPAQEDALKYLSEAAEKHPEDRIYVVGHSKGGNLAIYAASGAPSGLKGRIEKVMGFDNPGFTDHFIASAGYAEMKAKITTVLSQHAMIGMIMNRAGSTLIVRSSVSGPLAHDGFKWQAVRTGFVKEKEFSGFSLSFRRALDDTLREMTAEKKQEFIDELFSVLEATGAKTLTDLADRSVRTRTATLGKIAKSPAVREFSKRMMKEMERAGRSLLVPVGKQNRG